MTDTSAATTPTAPAAQQLNTYYLSDNEHDFEPVLVPFTLTENKFPFVSTAPDASLKQPKYDWGKNVWVENAAESQGHRITALEDAQKSLDESVQQLTQDHAATVQANNQLSTKLDGLQQLVVQSNANTAQIMSVLNSMNTKKEGTN